MRYVKTLGLLAAAALMAFAGTASATTVKSTGVNYTSTITAESSNIQMHGAFITVMCAKSHLESKIESHGPTVTAEGTVSKLSFSGCNYAVHVEKGGSLIFHTTTTPHGTVTSTGASIKMNTSVGECIFTTNATDIGTFTGGTGARIDIDSAAIPRTGGAASFFCGSTGTLTGSYTFSTPHNLTLH